jgi:hypothetical protein
VSGSHARGGREPRRNQCATAHGHAHDDHTHGDRTPVAHPTVVALARTLRAGSPRTPDTWGRLLAELVRAIALATDEHGVTLIGHVKAVAMTPDGYVRASAVDVAHEPTSERRGDASCAETDLTVNVLVYGLPGPVVGETAEAALVRVASAAHVAATPRLRPTPGPA